MSRRALAAVGILTLWLGGVAALAKRELFRGEAERLARAAIFVAPGSEYYAISDGTRQIGFASSTIDTLPSAIRIEDVVITTRGDRDPSRKWSARMSVLLTRTLRLISFHYEVAGGRRPFSVEGRVSGDTLLTLVVDSSRWRRPRRRRIPIAGPLLLPTLVPMAIALGERPTVGQQYTYHVFSPITGSASPVTVHVRAESLFVLPDSAAYDTTAGRWVVAHEDTVRAWRIEQEEGGVLTGWIDGRGRMVEAAPLDRMHMRRTAYELAFLNWADRTDRDAPAAQPGPGGAAPPHPPDDR